jgi:VWFA-related protein
MSYGFAPLRVYVSILFVLVLVCFPQVSADAQEVDDTIRIKTRVVFLDALVKDKKTGSPITTLSTENFTVLDDGRPRELSYFTREGQARKPLALVLIMDLRDDGAGRFLKRPEILKAMEEELAKLPPEDEVAILAMDLNGEDENRLWLTDFTHDRAKLSAALARVREFIDVEPEQADRSAANNSSSVTLDVDTEARTSPSPSPSPSQSPSPSPSPASKEVVETETIKGRNGAVVTRTLHADGSVSVKRTNKKGDVTIEVGDIYDMAAAVREATKHTQKVRPNSQASLVWISDGIAPIFFEDRDATEQILIRNNVIFNSLTVELRTLFKFLLPVGKPIAGWMGVSLYGSAKLLAQRSGGEAVKVGRVKDYGTGLSKIIGNLTARYSLGFQLAENEVDDGRMHSLEVRVKAVDEKGKNRKILVSSRQGYYMSSATPTQTAKTQ